jgi:hypothetical protein
MVGALGTMTDPRVWDSDDDKRSGTSRSVHDGRSHRPDNKRERRVLARREYHAPSLPLMTASFSMGHQARKEHQRW